MSLGFQDCFALPDDQLGYVRDYDAGVLFDIDGVHEWGLPTPEPLLMLRAGWLGAVVVIGQGGGSGNALVTVDGQPVMSFGPTFGVNPVAIGPDGVYVVRTGARIDVLSVSGVFLRRIDGAFGSQGIRDVQPDGELRLADDWHSRTIAGLTLVQPCQRGALWVGQHDPPQIAGVADGFIRTTVQAGLGFEPHIAELPSGYAVCARPWLAPVLLPPYPPYIGPAPEPPDPPQPPQETRMIAYGPPIPSFKPADALEPHPDGDLAVRLHDRVYLCCTPDGVLETRDYANGGQPGSWERFRRAKSGGALVAERSGGKVHVLTLAE